MTAWLFGTILPWLLVALGGWLGYQLVRQNGRILLRLESIEEKLPARAAPPRSREPRGLPPGLLAPDFDLPDLTGARHTLAGFRGRDLLLIFFNPQCGFCTNMLADLAALPAEGSAERAMPIVITTGDAAENRRLVEQHGLGCLVLLQQQTEVADRYRAQGTPMGYRIDKEGKLASNLTVGVEALLRLADLTAAVPPPAAPRSPAMSRPPRSGRDAHKDYRSLAGSRLNRNGLKAGTAAPGFQLPRLDGGELALDEHRGRRVLLVFSDPHCGPCMELAPRLQEVHLTRPDLAVLVVSRGDPEENREKAAALGLTYPIVLQKQWEVSLQYAMFATPIGYLIDEQGVLASDVAVGIEPILALAEGEPSLNGKEVAWAHV